MNPQAPKVTLAMILCGIVSAAGMAAASAASAASAATQDADVPSRAVKYDSASLLTDTGAHVVYRKIVFAAAAVCPANPGSVILSAAVQQCRAQAIAAAVMKVNNARLAAIHENASRKG
jgi:UrcA family protein